MEKEEIKKRIGTPILRPLCYLQGLTLLAFFCSPIIWIWYGWSLAWKIGLTGFIATGIIYLVYKVAQGVVNEEVEKTYNELNNPEKKSSFLQRIADLKAKRSV